MSSKNNGNDLAISLLSRAHSPDSTTRIFNEKVKQRPLHLKPTEPNNGQHQRRVERQRKLAERKKKLKPKPLSARQKRRLCLYEIPKSEQKYSIYEGLHRLWVGYVQEILGLTDNSGGAPKVTAQSAAILASADFHGAEVEVVRSRCVSRVGVKGIVIKDSKFTFEVVTPKDVVKVLPKEHTIFCFRIPVPGKEGNVENDIDNLENVKRVGKDFVFEIHGDQFQVQASDRANRKFKSHFLRDV